MPVPGSLIVPDSRPPPVLLLGAGALLLAGLVIRTLRRRRGRGFTRSAGASTIVRSAWRQAAAQGAGMLELPLETLRRVPEPVPVARSRVEEGAQKRGRAAKKRP